MEVVSLIGRILFCIVFLSAARDHLTKVPMMAQYLASKGVPAPKIAVVLTGLMLLLGGLSVLLGIWIKVGAAFLVITLVFTALTFHNFWTLTDPMARGDNKVHFQKNLALAGAALLVFSSGRG